LSFATSGPAQNQIFEIDASGSVQKKFFSVLFIHLKKSFGNGEVGNQDNQSGVPLTSID
jgi:hypothetical protein